ncbi:dienelactone hydrolase family protein [Neorhizobium sp. JUb45]|uniref:alpha/beta hydrolase family protein n=1 Tax=unclassified Neorhizobium TaxID=2629175 RepID=UPI001042F939|nr:dienelactone hydrolase family protein [Neorhizobium sp. JUb45]TCR07319.1 putative dienelactone hydrolase [Neorhizobium sp. JUb45]
MRRFAILVALPLLFLASVCGAQNLSGQPSYAAGFSRLPVETAEGAFDMFIWYPTSVAEEPWQAGPFTISATRGAAPVKDRRFPVVLFSHGSGGTPLSHRNLAAMLARAGYIVVAPLHVGDAAGHPRLADKPKVLSLRPRQATAALEAFLQNARFAPFIDAERIGMIGYSAGGYTALVLAGAHPNFQQAIAYCATEGRSDIGSCGQARDRPPQPAARNDAALPQTNIRLKAVVLMDPLGMLFDQAGLAALTMPILMMRPQDDSYLRAAPNALELVRNLPKRPQETVVEGAHFVFIDPCPEVVRAEAALICEDAPTVDRVKIHVDIERDVRDFLGVHL